jgi:hypothetical protein
MHPFAPVHGRELWIYIAAATAGWIALFALLHRLPLRHKRALTIALTFIAGLFYTLEFYLPAKSHWFPWWKNPLSDLIVPMGNAMNVIFGFTLALGLINLAMIHGRNIARKRPGWFNSAAFFAAMISMIVFGLWQTYTPDTNRPAALGLSCAQVHRVYDVLFNGLLQPLGATVFSILAFYMATAAFRAFRIRAAEAALMMASAFIVMLGQVPVGRALTNWLPAHGFYSQFRLERFMGWILNTWSMAGVRAVGFGLAVGGLSMALRIWLSLERGSFFEMRESKP